MGAPFEHRNPLNGAIIEIMSAMSALNQEPDPLTDTGDPNATGLLSETDGWVRHAMVHLEVALRLARAAVDDACAIPWPIGPDGRLMTRERLISDLAADGFVVSDDATDPFLIGAYAQKIRMRGPRSDETAPARRNNANKETK